MTSQHGEVLYDLKGASMTTHKGRAGEETMLQVMHPTGTDFEHDSACIVHLTLYGVKFEQFWGWGEIDFTGYLHAAQYYDDGVDPAKISEDGFVASPKMCTDDRCEEPHPIMRYQPPAQQQTKGPVWIEVYMTEPQKRL